MEDHGGQQRTTDGCTKNGGQQRTTDGHKTSKGRRTPTNGIEKHGIEKH